MDPTYFATLRELLLQEPNYAHWLDLLDHLDASPDKELQEAALAYAKDHLQDWPDQVRRIELSDPEHFIGASHTPPQELAKTLCCRCILGIRALRKLLHDPKLPHFTGLHVEGAYIGDEGTIQLAQAGHQIKQLISLNLASNGLTHEGVETLTQIQALRPLQVLHLSDNDLGAMGMHKLAYRFSQLRPRELCLDRCQIGDEGLTVLARTHRLNTLHTLDLSHNQLHPDAAMMLAKAEGYPQLHTLRLDHNQLNTNAALTLLQSDAFPTLMNLHLQENDIPHKDHQELLLAAEARQLTLCL